MESPKRRRAPAQRPQEILDAARAEFAERGFAGARLDDVARRAGCSKAAIYLYYSDKSALFEAVIRSAVLPDLEDLRTQLLASTLSVSDVLRLVAQRAVLRILDGQTPDLIKIVIGESRTFPELAGFWHAEIIARMLPVIVGLIRRGVDSGEFQPVNPDFTARSFISSVIFAAIWRSVFEPVGAERLDTTAFIKHHLELILAGLRPGTTGGTGAGDPS